MYLARLAYVPYRDAFRRELSQKRQMYGFHADEFKETKEEYEADYNSQYSRQEHAERFDDCSSVFGYRSRLRATPNGALIYDCTGESLVDKWEESQIRNAIHNPIPRHEWGKAAPSNNGSFKWVLSDGLWVRNFAVQVTYTEENQ